MMNIDDLLEKFDNRSATELARDYAGMSAEEIYETWVEAWGSDFDPQEGMFVAVYLSGLGASAVVTAAELGRKGGAATSEAKAAAARVNGKLGGRPRKTE